MTRNGNRDGAASGNNQMPVGVTSVSDRLGRFLSRRGGQRFCAECLTRAVPFRDTEQARRAAGGLAAHSAYRIEDDGDCSRCNNTRRTIRALWVGL